MVLTPIQCPFSGSEDVRKYGKRNGKQIYRCDNDKCDTTTFRKEYTYKACDPKIKSQIFDLTVNGNGTRAIGRILSISKDTVTSVLKKVKT
jgi:transposase-like protein